MEFTIEKKMDTEVVEKVWEDPAIKKELVDYPATTMEKFTIKNTNLSGGKILGLNDQTN